MLLSILLMIPKIRYGCLIWPGWNSYLLSIDVFRMKEINAAELEDVINYFNEALSDFKLKKIGHAVLEESETLVKTLGKTIGLRTLDAIHLATFNLFNQLSEIVFVASDETLLGAARSLSAKVINPVIGDQIV